MKRNKITKAASIVFALTLITTMMIGGTFAKYTTSGSTNNSARVAKWGVTIDANNAKLYSTAYGDVVLSSNSKEVVAPGTKGSVELFSIKGQPEVDFEVTFANTSKGSDISYGTDDTGYYPVKYTLYKGSSVLGDQSNKKLSEIVTYLISNPITVEAGQSVNDTYKLEWTWSMTGEDVKDTALGDAIAKDLTAETATADDGTSLNLVNAFNLDITATQIGEDYNKVDNAD
jgi:hypothetical protein